MTAGAVVGSVIGCAIVFLTLLAAVMTYPPSRREQQTWLSRHDKSIEHPPAPVRARSILIA
jgi:hypothetical protein